MIYATAASLLDDLPTEAAAPEIQKMDANADVILWFSLTSDHLSLIELTDYARRYLEDRFSTLDGVARVRIGGGLDYSMRIWLDRKKLAARNLTVNDIENALHAENIELPAGSVESLARQFTVRVERGYKTAQDFRELVLARGAEGYLVRLGDVARVEIAAREERTLFRGNGTPLVGIGVIKQSTANTLEVARQARAEAALINASLLEGMSLTTSYDTSVFIEHAINEVYKTLFIAIALVIVVIYLFLGNMRATLIPAVTVPVSLIAAFIILYTLGYTINLLTLLALVLAIGLVVDDAIVVLENVYRRIEHGEAPLAASFLGTRQVSFAVIATTVVLAAVFVPIAFLQGSVGRLFSEFAITLAGAVLFSGLIALTLCPMLSSKILRSVERQGKLAHAIDARFEAMRKRYIRTLTRCLKHPSLMLLLFAGGIVLSVALFLRVPGEFTPKEDRGAIFISVSGPEGASFDYIKKYMEEIEKRLMPLVEKGEVKKLLVRAPRSFGATSVFSDGQVTLVLEDWGNRRSGWEIMDDVNKRIADLPGVRAVPVMRQGMGGGSRKPVQFVLGGGSYAELTQWRDIILSKAAENPKLTGIDHDYKETKPQLRVIIDRNRAGDLGVSIANISRTLETMLGSRRATTFIDRGEEYDVILEGERDIQRSPSELANIYVRSERTGKLIPLSNLVTIKEFADTATLNRYNRVRSITLEANLAEGYSLGEALDYLEKLVRENLPPGAVINYKGQSLEYKRAGGAVYSMFLLSLVIVFLVLAAQFESFVHPLVIILTVPLAMAGALFGLWFTGQSLNIYSQIGLIMLAGLATKNGILLVDFINQLRDEGLQFSAAILEGSSRRLRPIVMTSATTIMGAVPLILSSGAGAETRFVIGIVIFFGVAVATFFTLFIIPVAYDLLARRTLSPQHVKKELEKQLKQKKC